MKKLFLALVSCAFMQTLQAQTLKNTFTLGGGTVTGFMRDKQASPLVYKTQAAVLHLDYTRQSRQSRFQVQLTPNLGTSLPHRFSARTFYNGLYSYSINSNYYGVNLKADYQRKLDKMNTAKITTFVGGGVQNAIAVADAIGNYWGTNITALNASGTIQWQPFRRHAFTGQLSVPVLARVTRLPYANFPKSTDQTNLEAFFQEGTHLATINKLQFVQADATYMFRLSQRWGAGVTYRFAWFHYPEPQPIRSYSQSYIFQFGYNF